jgi:Spx/MgsR family transcriptional regulator
VSDLEGRGFELVKHNLANDAPSRELLEQLVAKHGLDKVFNRKSVKFKELGLADRKLTESESIDLMVEEPNLIKRPLVLSKGKAVFGYVPEEYDRL